MAKRKQRKGLKKKPKKREKVKTTKTPSAIPLRDPYTLNPSWQISLMEMVDPYGWHRISSTHLDKVRKRLRNFESMTWREILVDAVKDNHRVNVHMLTKDARDRLEKLGQSDIDELVSLKVSAKQRVWGILDRATLRVLWWDPEHSICPSSKKHT